jgi:hypothetical protein
MLPIPSYFSSSATSSRVPLDRRLRNPVRTAPLAGSSTATLFRPRVHRPVLVATAPPRIRAPDSANAFSDGWRETRIRPLALDDLWASANTLGPPPVTVLEDHHKCCICLQLKSHPVTCVFRPSLLLHFVFTHCTLPVPALAVVTATATPVYGFP